MVRGGSSGGGRGGRGGGGCGGGYTGLYRFRFFRSIFGSGYTAEHNEVLRRVAIARGLRDTDELLVALGRQETGISIDEAYDLLIKEGRLSESSDIMYTYEYAGGMRGKECQNLLRYDHESFEREANSLIKDNFWSKTQIRRLKKYCGYKGEK